MPRRGTSFAFAEKINLNDDGGKIVFITSYPGKIIGNAFYKIKACNTILKCNPHVEQEIEDTILLAREAVVGESLFLVSNRYEDLYISIKSILLPSNKSRCCISHSWIKSRTSSSEI